MGKRKKPTPVPTPVVPTPAPTSGLWVTGYYGAWQTWIMKPSNIDFDVITHALHFVLVPNANGSLTYNTDFSDANCIAFVNAAHSKGRKAIISVGGWDTDSGFFAAPKTTLITNIINFIKKYGYDGVDIDWEPVPEEHGTAFINFLTSLRTELDKITPRPLLIVATVSGWYYKGLLGIQAKLDQINLMTYDLGGDWLGKVWHNSPLYSGGARDKYGLLMPSVDTMLSTFLASGFSASKLGIGIPFYAKAWNTNLSLGASVTSVTRTDIIYRDIISNNYGTPQYDLAADVPFYKLTDKFISFDNEQSVKSKVLYAKSKGIGGIILFELGQAWIPTKIPSDPLVKVVKSALV